MKRLLLVLIACDIFFVVLHLLLGERYDIFNLDRERTPAALWSALQYIGCGTALFIVFLAQQKKRLLWGISALLFTLLGLDEISELHENAAYYLVKYFPPFPFLHSGTPMWIVFLSPLILAAFLLIVWMIRHLFKNRPMLGWLTLGGMVLFIGALGLEFAGGVDALQPALPFFVPLEEGAELLAGTLFLAALTTYAHDECSKTFRRIPTSTE